MSIEDADSSNESKSGIQNVDFSAGKIRLIERYLIISMFFLLAAILLLVIGQLLISGCFIFASISLGLVVFRKITQLNRKYISSINSFLKTDSRKDRTITDFSHKIREPLNNLVLTSEMFTKTDLNSNQKELMESFISSTKSMINTVNELTMESAEQMSYESRRHIQFNIGSTIDHVVELYKLKENVNIVFSVNILDTGSLDYIGDPVSLKQILLELFGRIEEHSQTRKANVMISLQSEKGNSNEDLLKITIEVDKNVLLIDEGNIEGSNAARLISLIKGKYYQHSGTNSTSLDIFFKIRAITPKTLESTTSRKIGDLIKKEKVHKQLKDLNLLLVEDNIINQKITLLTLSPLVKNIDAVSNGKEALDKFGTNNYDLILMDIQMPVMSGLVAAEKIRRLELTTNTRIPMIAITANAMIGDKEKCMSAGFDDYITKPFQPSVLIERILKHV